jgi:hypothetical protein
VQPLPSCKPLNSAIRSHRWIATGISRARQQPSHAALRTPVGASPARERAPGALDFIVQALRHEPITPYGDGTQTRSFCYADDLIEGLLRLMQSPSGFTGPVNLGNPGEFTMLELADAVRELTGSRSELVHRPLPADDPRQRQPDITLAREHLDWEPKIPLRKGLKPTMGYFEQLLSLGSVQRRAVARADFVVLLPRKSAPCARGPLLLYQTGNSFRPGAVQDEPPVGRKNHQWTT